MQIVSERPLCRGWERCFNYPDSLLSGGGTAVTRWPYAQQPQLILVLYLLRGGGGCEERGLMLTTDLCNSEMRKSREFYQLKFPKVHLSMDVCPHKHRASFSLLTVNRPFPDTFSPTRTTQTTTLLSFQLKHIVKSHFPIQSTHWQASIPLTHIHKSPYNSEPQRRENKQPEGNWQRRNKDRLPNNTQKNNAYIHTRKCRHTIITP